MDLNHYRNNLDILQMYIIANPITPAFSNPSSQELILHVR